MDFYAFILLWVAAYAVLSSVWFWTGKKAQRRKTYNEILAETDGEIPAATVAIHIITPHSVGVVAKVFSETLSEATETDPTAVLKVASLALDTAIAKMEPEGVVDPYEALDDQGRRGGPYL